MLSAINDGMASYRDFLQKPAASNRGERQTRRHRRRDMRSHSGCGAAIWGGLIGELLSRWRRFHGRTLVLEGPRCRRKDRSADSRVKGSCSVALAMAAASERPTCAPAKQQETAQEKGFVRVRL